MKRDRVLFFKRISDMQTHMFSHRAIDIVYIIVQSLDRHYSLNKNLSRVIFIYYCIIFFPIWSNSANSADSLRSVITVRSNNVDLHHFIEVKKPRAGVKTQTNWILGLNSSFFPSCWAHVESDVRLRLGESYSNASVKPTDCKLSGCVHTNAQLQMPYLSCIKSKQRLGALSMPDHTSEFFSFTNLDKRPSSNKPQPSSSYSGCWGHAAEWLVAFKSSAVRGIRAWSNDVCNLIEHQSFLITAMLTIRSGGWRIRARKTFCVCLFCAHCGGASERIRASVLYLGEIVGKKRWCRRAEVPKKGLLCVWRAFFSFSFFFFRCLCA